MIYYVEDDANIRDLTLYTLRKEGFEAEGFANAALFREACARSVPDLVLLDIMLPEEDGLSLIKSLRANSRTENVPVIMVSAKGSERDKVAGLDAGADDYLAKPFGMAELVSRCNALLRRVGRDTARKAGEGGAMQSDWRLTCDPIAIDEAAHEAYVSGVLLELTPREYELLRKLIEEQGKALHRSTLLEEVWHSKVKGDTRTVDAHVQTLRKKLNQASPDSGDLIQTVRSVGYRIRAGV